MEIIALSYPFDQFEWLLIGFALTALVYLLQYWLVFARFAFGKKSNNEHACSEPVSVIVCAKNEKHHLENFLPLILNQNYPNYEVVVVNDCSDDDTKFLLEELSRKYTHLKVVTLFETITFFRGKKFPLSIGIKSASNEWLLFTDADCYPVDEFWIQSMSRQFNPNVDFVLGYGKYEKEAGILNTFIRFDTFYIAIQYLSFALSGLPYMGVGRNMAYRRSIFMKNKGFTSHYSIQSGDDDLFVNQHAHKKNTKIETHHSSFTISKPKDEFFAWIRQKKRHLTTGGHYRLSHKTLLALFNLNLLFFYALFVLLILCNYNLIIVFSIFGIKLISQLIVIKKCGDRLNEKDLLLISPLMEIFFMVFNPMIYLSNKIRKPYQWK